MDTSSEHSFPIFISSTDYDLKDLRAELARYLKELGYRPVMSSAEGFPDNSPKLEPWESCLQALEHCFVMILIIDGRYSTAFQWPNFQDQIGERTVSPTHGEYLYARSISKRTLVFVRREVMTYYQVYRQAVKKFQTEEETKNALKILPPNIEYETLKFLHEVKTTKPIPWIKEFVNVTDVKEEVRKKMLNQLAEIFLIKTLHTETIITAFNQALQMMTPEVQLEMLKKVHAAAPIISEVEQVAKLKEEVLQNQELIQKANEDLEAINRYQEKISELNGELAKLKSASSDQGLWYLNNGNLQVKSVGPFGNFTPIGSSFLYQDILQGPGIFDHIDPKIRDLFLIQKDDSKIFRTGPGAPSKKAETDTDTDTLIQPENN